MDPFHLKRITSGGNPAFGIKGPRLVVSNAKSPIAPKPKLLDQVREAIRTRHYSIKTEEAYAGWIKRFILYHNKRHPAEMGEPEIGQFLSSLATDRHVSASTQNQALNALLFLYHEVLNKNIGYIDGVVRAKGRGSSRWCSRRKSWAGSWDRRAGLRH